MLTDEDKVLLKLLASSPMMLVQCRKPDGSELARRILMTVGAGLWESQSNSYNDAKLACARLDEAYKTNEGMRTVFNSVLDEIAQRQLKEHPDQFDKVLMAMYQVQHMTTTEKVSAKLAASSAVIPVVKSVKTQGNVEHTSPTNKSSLTDEQTASLKMLANGEGSLIDRCYQSEDFARSLLMLVATGLSEDATSINYENAKMTCARLNEKYNNNHALRNIFNNVFDETAQRQLNEHPEQFDKVLNLMLLKEKSILQTSALAANADKAGCEPIRNRRGW